LSVFFPVESIIFARPACTSFGSIPASSISSTIQYQLPTVSTATGEPRSQLLSRNSFRAPRRWSIRPSWTNSPSVANIDAKVYRL
jgi:hypothetical protein